MAMSNNNLLATLRERAKGLPSFMAYAISLYQHVNGHSDEQIADWLDCSPAQCEKLGLCRRPLGTDLNFRDHVEEIANFAGADPLKLAHLLRTTESIVAFRDAPLPIAGTQPLRVAAREASKSKNESQGEAADFEGSR